MGEPALAIVDEAAGEEAVSQTIRLTLIDGGATAAEAGGAVAAAEAAGAVASGEVAAGGAAAAGIGGAAVATAGIALVIIGLAALGYYLYKRSKAGDPQPQPKVPVPPQFVQPCPPGNPVEPVPKPGIRPKPVPLNPDIPEPKRSEIARSEEQRRVERCRKLWDEIQRRTNSRRMRGGADFQGLKYRLWDQICSKEDPRKDKGEKAVGGSQKKRLRTGTKEACRIHRQVHTTV